MKKFIVTITDGWKAFRFEFSKQEEACLFMGKAVNSSVEQVKCTLEVEDITNEEKQDN